MNILIISIAWLLSVSAWAQKASDQKAIKSMCGCHEVKFQFAETFSYPKDTSTYKPSKTLLIHALEWIELAEDKPNKIVLQHILLAGKEMIVKHWRQDWLYENANLYDYNGFNDWNFIQLPSKKVKGQWTQKVYGTDDEPRYEGAATWAHLDGRHFWESVARAPLPRREFTKRSDYNILKRANVHEVTNSGWIHDQDNVKIIRDENGQEYALAQEKGYTIYTKVEDAKCKAAQEWWQQNKEFWAHIRAAWDKEFSKNKNIKLQDKIDGKSLSDYLQALQPTGAQEEIDKVISRFVVLK